jgi:hypothetical protein
LDWRYLQAGLLILLLQHSWKWAWQEKAQQEGNFLSLQKKPISRGPSPVGRSVRSLSSSGQQQSACACPSADSPRGAAREEEGKPRQQLISSLLPPPSPPSLPADPSSPNPSKEGSNMAAAAAPPQHQQAWWPGRMGAAFGPSFLCLVCLIYFIQVR